MTRLLLATTLLASTLLAACGGGGTSTPTGSPVASDCIPTYALGGIRDLLAIADITDRTAETTAGALSTDLAAAHLSVLEGPASLATDATKLDELIALAETARNADATTTVTLARLQPGTASTPRPFNARVAGGSYGILAAPYVEFEVIIDGCPDASGKIARAVIRVNPLPWSVTAITRRCTDGPIDADRIAREGKPGGRHPGYTSGITQAELDGLHAARCAS